MIERVGDVRFVVAGSGTAEADLRRQASELGLDPYGTFLGWIGDDVLHSLYRIADLTVVPSLYEPFGLVALEAMASGCPCIVADTGGLREIVPADDRVGCASTAATPSTWRRWSSACSPTRRCATAWWPRPPSTSCPSTGPTWRSRLALLYGEPRRPAVSLRPAALLAAVAGAGAPSSTPTAAGSVVDGQPRYPENTMAAFKNASRAGYVLELDVKLTSGPRAGGDPRRHARPHHALHRRGGSKTLAQVASARTCSAAAHSGVAPASAIPTLAEVFLRPRGAPAEHGDQEPADRPGLRRHHGFANTVMAAVSASGSRGSRHRAELLAAQPHRGEGGCPGARRRTSPWAGQRGGPAFAQANGHEWVSPGGGREALRAPRRGLKVVPYTLNAPAEFRAAAPPAWTP